MCVWFYQITNEAGKPIGLYFPLQPTKKLISVFSNLTQTKKKEGSPKFRENQMLIRFFKNNPDLALFDKAQAVY